MQNIMYQNDWVCPKGHKNPASADNCEYTGCGEDKPSRLKLFAEVVTGLPQRVVTEVTYSQTDGMRLSRATLLAVAVAIVIAIADALARGLGMVILVLFVPTLVWLMLPKSQRVDQIRVDQKPEMRLYQAPAEPSVDPSATTAVVPLPLLP